MSSAKSDSFNIFFFIFCFSSVIAMARTFETMLNKIAKNGRPCLVLDLAVCCASSLSHV